MLFIALTLIANVFSSTEFTGNRVPGFLKPPSEELTSDLKIGENGAQYDDTYDIDNPEENLESSRQEILYKEDVDVSRVDLTDF